MWNEPLCIVVLCSRTFVRMGIRYARLLIVTAEPRRALKAVDEPR
jgi:hypothetical protein